MRLVWGTVSVIEGSQTSVQELIVALDGGQQRPAVAYPLLSGECRVKDRVLVNTTAMDKALGTGGKDFVVARLGEGRGTVLDRAGEGHIMKLRYTPLQVDVMSVESQESPHHEVMQSATDLAGMPVVCCGLHSQVPLVAAAIKSAGTGMRVAYCMTDHASLMLPLSNVMRLSSDAGLIDASVTCGQALGGDVEAVNLHSGLLAAKHVLEADIAIVAIGPGVVGTATPFGHGGIAVGEAINAVSVLGGTPVACLRISFADSRQRHRGVSHHSLAALGRIALAPAKVAVPTLPQEFSDAIETDLDAAGVWRLHERVVSAAGHMPPPSMRGVEVKSMGRGIEDDPAFFAASFAAGDIAFRIASGNLA